MSLSFRLLFVRVSVSHYITFYVLIFYYIAEKASFICKVYCTYTNKYVSN